MEYGDWLKEITEEDIPKQFRWIVGIIGIEATAKLSDHSGGVTIYVPKLEALLERKRNELIKRDVQVIGYKETARKYRLTEVWVRQIADEATRAAAKERENAQVGLPGV